MCEIFPETDNFFFIISVRVGLIFISVLSITTGATALGVAEQRTDVGYDTVVGTYNNATHIHGQEDVLSDLHNFISTTVTMIALIYMIAGWFLYIATFTDQEGLAQLFVWMVFFNIVLGCFLIVAIAFECVTHTSKCIFGDMDWLSSATSLVVMFAYLVVWFYFISVANSYVLNGYT